MFEPRLGQGHAGVVPSQPMISEGAAAVTRGVFRNRWRTLMSVDDLIADVVHLVEAELGLAEHTYFIYTSDHGFQLGQFNILMVQHSAPHAPMPQCPNAPMPQCPDAPMPQCPTLTRCAWERLTCTRGTTRHSSPSPPEP